MTAKDRLEKVRTARTGLQELRKDLEGLRNTKVDHDADLQKRMESEGFGGLLATPIAVLDRLEEIVAADFGRQQLGRESRRPSK